MSDKRTSDDGLARRDLLKLGAVGAVAAGATGLGASQAKASVEAGPGTVTLQDSEHVRQYYDTLRF
jgi:hypothetical protein